jgi:mono/diheme cytochrome c family protein
VSRWLTAVLARLLPGCLLFAMGPAWAVGAEPATAAAGEAVAGATLARGFIEQHCLRCHDAKRQEGEFRLDTLAADFTNEQGANRWAEVMTRINAAEMPPKDEPRPSAAEIAGIVGWIAEQITAGQAARMSRRGPVSLYRLSRDEYAATVLDLLGVHFDPTLPGALNEDPRWHGFERIGALLTLSPSHVDRYVKAADTVLGRAFPATEPKSTLRKADAIDLRHSGKRQQFEAQGIAGRVRVPLWPDAEMNALFGDFGRPENSGLYRCRIRVSGLPGLDGRVPHLSVWHTGLKQSIYDEDVVAAEDAPVTLEFETYLTLPVGLSLRNETPVVFSRVGNHTLNVLNGGGLVFLGSRDMSQTNPTGFKLFTDDGRAIYPMLLVDSIEWEGPIVTDADRAKRAGFMPAADGGVAESRACLERFAAKAWRRPARPEELARYVRVVEQELAAKEPLRTAHLAALTAMLASKNFFYLQEGDATARRGRVDAWELASRLSYFFWGSMPDEPLFAAAASGRLLERQELEAQLSRMLGDPKISRFTTSFTRQWLQLHRLGIFPPDMRLYPDYDLWLEKSMALEPAAFFAEVFATNGSIREFLVSDWALVNPRLAAHYRLPALPRTGFQRVTLRPEDHRGGLLTQAGVLSLTSDGTRHRPVHRGVWVSEAIFGRTPPPPPPNVEPLPPTAADKPKATVRMQLEAHSTQAACAACHAAIDPYGLAFDNYDAIGRWRTEETVAAGIGTNPPVNASGTLPDGRAFSGPDDFRRLLADDLDGFARSFVEQLATFALRRAMTIDDAATLDAIAAAGKADGYRLRTLLQALVTSDLFLAR